MAAQNDSLRKQVDSQKKILAAVKTDHERAMTALKKTHRKENAATKKAAADAMVSKEAKTKAAKQLADLKREKAAAVKASKLAIQQREQLQLALVADPDTRHLAAVYGGAPHLQSAGGAHSPFPMLQ